MKNKWIIWVIVIIVILYLLIQLNVIPLNLKTLFSIVPQDISHGGGGGGP